MSQMNPKKNLYNTTFSVQLPYIAGHSLKTNIVRLRMCKSRKKITSYCVEHTTGINRRTECCFFK